MTQQAVAVGPTAPSCAFTVSRTADAAMSKTWMAPSLVPTMACLLPGANMAHSPCAPAPQACQACWQDAQKALLALC